MDVPHYRWLMSYFTVSSAWLSSCHSNNWEGDSQSPAKFEFEPTHNERWQKVKILDSWIPASDIGRWIARSTFLLNWTPGIWSWTQLQVLAIWYLLRECECLISICASFRITGIVITSITMFIVISFADQCFQQFSAERSHWKAPNRSACPITLWGIVR